MKPSPESVWEFAQAISDRPVPRPEGVAPSARDRELWEFLADVAPEVPNPLVEERKRQAQAARQREELEWLASISDRYADELARVRESEARAEASAAYQARLATRLEEADWDPSKHPRRGGPPNAGWFASTGGSGGGSNLLQQRNAALAPYGGAEHAARSRRLANDIESAARLPGELRRAVNAGLGTGSKAVVNGTATAVKNVATLGLSPGQLELIGVTQEDRDRGYDTAVTIATASGEVLIAVGTGGLANALRTGGVVARSASGALLVYDAAGNAVGSVQGIYDASKNGVNLTNGAQIFAGTLGLSANAAAIKQVPPAPGAKPTQPAPSTASQAAPPPRPVAPEPTNPNPVPPRPVAGNPETPTSNAKQQPPPVPKRNWSPQEIDDYIANCPSKKTPSNTKTDRYEIEHTGPLNYTVSAGEEHLDIDGYRGDTILESKHVEHPDSSPFISGSTCYEPVRRRILDDVRSELRRARAILDSGDTPFQSVEIITNSPEAKLLFEDLLNEFEVPGRVSIKPE